MARRNGRGATDPETPSSGGSQWRDNLHGGAGTTIIAPTTIVRHYTFVAQLKYDFVKDALDKCEHCGKVDKEHADNSCLFEPTEFKPQMLRVFFDELVAKGGRLSIEVNGMTLHQELKGDRVDGQLSSLKAVIQSTSLATLEYSEGDPSA